MKNQKELSVLGGLTAMGALSWQPGGAQSALDSFEQWPVWQGKTSQ